MTEDMAPRVAAKTVSALVCHDHVKMALDCLGSMQRFLDDCPKLRIHDDGSLTRDDVDLLNEKLSPVTIVERKLGDERVRDELEQFPHLLKLRERYPYLMKATDAVLWCEEDVYAFADADILFMRPVASPFELRINGPRAIYMADREPSYSVRSWGKLMSPQLELPAKINCGIIACDRRLIDFELFEWFVRKPWHHQIPGVVEQTLWAALGAKIGCGVLDPQRVRVMRGGEDTRDLAVGHFTARCRHLLPDFVEASSHACTNDTPLNIAVYDAGRCSATDLLLYEIRRVKNRMWGSRTTSGLF